MKHFSMSRKLIILINILIILIEIFILFCMDLPMRLFWTYNYPEKYSFTDKEISLISDVIHIRCNTIEKMIGSYGKDCSFIIYISDFEEQDLDINYTKTLDFYGEYEYIENNTNNKMFPTTCYFEKYEEQDVLLVEFHGYDSTLYKIVPQSSYVILGFICLMCLILFLIFLIIKIKNEKKSLMNKSQK
ncbi:MAG: hypothetical protein HDT22_01930 [Ruminococcus sp.]|nr:hypothetical protein [Ruminococcus sp.]